MNSKSLPIKVGFLGGGQLARMLILEAHKLSLECHVYSEAKFDPAALVTSHWHSGSLAKTDALIRFIDKMDLVTFESEFVPTESLIQIAEKHADKIFPKVSIMKLMQNRQSQKELLQSNQLKTADFVRVQTAADLDKAWQTLGGAFVLKTCYGGYDGYGTYFAHQFSDLGELATVVANSETDFIAEKMIHFKKEMAAIFVRSAAGDCLNLPLVESKQRGGRCEYVVGPMKHSGFEKVQKKIFSMMKKLNYVGALGVEFFDTGKELLVNELAPRVHNSGHYSQDALVESQFLLHLQAGLGQKLKAPEILCKNFVMVNILGSGEKPLQIPKICQGAIHLYGKPENRLNRKMGHVNYLGSDAKKLLAKALKERKLFQS